MAANIYKENHYVPCWYQERFLPESGQRVFRYLDLEPEEIPRSKRNYPHKNRVRAAMGAVNSFKETDLYTVKYGRFE